MSTCLPSRQRRTALATLAAATAAVAAAPVLPGAEAQAAAPAPQPGSGARPASRGYALTDHIRRYYALARF